eukprot:TCONS_00038459-protein
MNGFKVLTDIAEKMKQNDVRKSLEKGKRYLKSNYPVKCSETSTLSSHSTCFALSYKDDPDLSTSAEISKEECADCTELHLVLNQIRDLVKETDDGDLQYDTNVAIADIEAYMKHQIRDAQQKLAKIMAFDQLSPETRFGLKDFCQKILPARFREGQKEYFGKKGMTLHVDVFFFKDREENLIKKVYFTAAYRCEQALVDSLCLADVVLEKAKKDFPNMSQLYAKSDNAPSYHGNYYLESLYKLCKDKDISLQRYDYNEPSRGRQV